MSQREYTLDEVEMDAVHSIERVERRLSWENQIELMERLEEFFDERLKELRNQSHV